jgi:hypothetical protein
VRAYLISEALKSFRDLVQVIPDLSWEELEYALKLESKTQRRPSVMSKLQAACVAAYRKLLKEKYIASKKESSGC